MAVCCGLTMLWWIVVCNLQSGSLMWNGCKIVIFLFSIYIVVVVVDDSIVLVCCVQFTLYCGCLM